MPALGPMVANLVRPIFSFCRDVQLWIKLRSDLFPDKPGRRGAEWASQTLAEFFDLSSDLIYSHDVRNLIMGPGDCFKPKGNAYSRFCGV